VVSCCWVMPAWVLGYRHHMTEPLTCQRCRSQISWRPEAEAYMAEVEVEADTFLVDCQGQPHVPPVGRHRAG
jgi:hypothetical protein